MHVAQRANGALEEHDAEARERDVELPCRQRMLLRVADLVAHVGEAGLVALAVGDREKPVGAVDPELEARLAEAAPDVEDLVALLHAEARQRDLAVALAVAGQEVPKADPLGRQNLVPAPDEILARLRGGHRGHHDQEA